MPKDAKKALELSDEEKIDFEKIMGENKVFDVQRVLVGYPLSDYSRFIICSTSN